LIKSHDRQYFRLSYFLQKIHKKVRKTIDRKELVLYNSEAVKFKNFTPCFLKGKKSMKGAVLYGEKSADCCFA